MIDLWYVSPVVAVILLSCIYIEVCGGVIYGHCAALWAPTISANKLYVFDFTAEKNGWVALTPKSLWERLNNDIQEHFNFTAEWWVLAGHTRLGMCLFHLTISPQWPDWVFSQYSLICLQFTIGRIFCKICLFHIAKSGCIIKQLMIKGNHSGMNLSMPSKYNQCLVWLASLRLRAPPLYHSDSSPSSTVHSDSIDTACEKFRFQKVSLLRSFTQRVGIQILLREYNFDNRQRQPFYEDDIINMYPVVKHIAPKVRAASDSLSLPIGGVGPENEGLVHSSLGSVWIAHWV